jgi:hypothetical protein
VLFPPLVGAVERGPQPLDLGGEPFVFGENFLRLC